MTWIKPHVQLRERPPRASVFDESISPRLRLARIIQAQFRNMCQSKAQLRDVMRSYGLPLPLRLLDARVLTARRATVIRWLALMNPSTLAQIIPCDATEAECLVAGPAKLVRGDGIPAGDQ